MPVHLWHFLGNDRESREWARLASICGESISQMMLRGLRCLHMKTGYIHGDFKGDNVLIGGGRTKDGCPNEVYISDFGLSRQIGMVFDRFENVEYRRSGHLVSSLFWGEEDVLGIRNGTGYLVDARIDFCSWAYVNVGDLRNPKLSLPWLGYPFGYNPWNGECGDMGPWRELEDVKIGDFGDFLYGLRGASLEVVNLLAST